jgi:hypothetical protein
MGQKVEIFSEHMMGLDFYLDPTMVNGGSADRIRKVLQNAIAALENNTTQPLTGLAADISGGNEDKQNASHRSARHRARTSA